MDIPYEDGKSVERSIYYLAPGERVGHRFYVRKQVTDQWGEPRILKKPMFHWHDEESHDRALAAARNRRAEIEQNKTNITWLRETFDEQRQSPREKNLLGNLGIEGDIGYVEPSEEEAPDLKEITFKQWLTAGLKETVDGKFDEKDQPLLEGYLRRIKTRNGKSDWAQKRAAFRHLQKHKMPLGKKLDEFSLEDLRRFRVYLEQSPSVKAKETIHKYVAVMRQAIGEWSDRASVYNPVQGSLRVKKHQYDGEEAPEKARSREHVLALRWALIWRMDRCRQSNWLPYRAMARYFFEVHAYTGLRVTPILFLKQHHHDPERGILKIRGAWSRDEGESDTKTARQKGDKGRGHRNIPLVEPANSAIVEWLERRHEFGFPTAAEEPIIFPSLEGGYSHDERIHRHYTKACEKTGIERFLPKWMRATVITRLATCYCPEAIRKALVGQEVEGIQRHYLSMQAESARPFLENLWQEGKIQNPYTT